MSGKSLSNFEKSRASYENHCKIGQLKLLKANPGKFQFMILGKSLWPKYWLTIGPIHVKESDYVELLGISIDKRVSFKKHIANLCWNAN